MKKIFSITAKLVIKKLYFRTSWRLINLLPRSYPDSSLLNYWYSSHWPDYQRWLKKNSTIQTEQLKEQYEEAKNWNDFPTFSVIIPVHNTPRSILTETILSVFQQSYPYWQLCIVDDGSSFKETIQTLKIPLMKDPRIDIYRYKSSQGISNASNRAIAMAKGQYIVFLDHDDRLSHDALFFLAKEIKKEPNTDLVYSDRDMINAKGYRYMHLFKPDWSPETLLSGNYAFHLVCYRFAFLKKIGLLRKQFDGSQDYDLLLRATEHNPIVAHIPKVLYSWRQQETSIAHLPETKEYVFKAGAAALKEAFLRRNLTVEVHENKSLWRGNYYIDFDSSVENDIHIITFSPKTKTKDIIHRIESFPKSGTLVFLSLKFTSLEECSIKKLAAPLILENIALTTGKILTAEHKLFHSGLFFTKEGRLFSPYRGFPDSEPGYMAITKILRNVSLPHPMCFALKTKLYFQLGGLNPNFSLEMSILDLALNARRKKWRIIFEPKAVFTLNTPIENEFGTILEGYHFSKKLKKIYPKGDPYYNPNLSNAKNTISLPFSEF